MPYSVRILADSLAPSGKRLTTFELTYPRFIHAEFLVHRSLSRNAASNRAIPTAKLLDQVRDDPALPLYWGRNEKGMQARHELPPEEKSHAEHVWLEARDDAVRHAERLLAVGLHKQVANRLLEPWLYITTIASATEWDNFFRLRNHPDAQPEIAWLAREMQSQYTDHTPEEVPAGGWHLPLVLPCEREGIEIPLLVRTSVGRCARVSYLTHDGTRDPFVDVALHDRLAAAGHWSPFEHVAMALATAEPCGNFVGWHQHRRSFTGQTGA